MGNLHPFTNSAVPIERMQIEQLVESMLAVQHITGKIAAAMVDRLDDIDGDADLEPEPDEANGDERDGSMGEDDFCIHNTGGDYAAGCPIADPGGCEHDGIEPEQFI